MQDITTSVTQAVVGLVGFPPFIGLIALVLVDAAIAINTAWCKGTLCPTRLAGLPRSLGLVVLVVVTGRAFALTSSSLALLADPFYALMALQQALSILDNVRNNYVAHDLPVPPLVGKLTARLGQIEDQIIDTGAPKPQP
jgi:hypothetical protein